MLRFTTSPLISVSLRSCAIVFSFLIIASSAHAANQKCVWTGGAGAANPQWSNALNWQGGNVPNLNDNVSLEFPAGVVNKVATNDIGLVSVRDVIFGDSGYTINGQAFLYIGGGGPDFTIEATVVGTNTIDSQIQLNSDMRVKMDNAASNLVITGGIVQGTMGNKKLQTDGTGGTLTLSGAGNYGGGTTVKTGTRLVVAADQALGIVASGTTVQDGAVLAFQGGINYTVAESISVQGSGINGTGAIQNVSGNNTFAGPISMAAATSFGSIVDNLTLTGVISGAQNVTKVDAGAVTFSANNTYSGTTTVLGGSLVAGGNANSGSGVFGTSTTAISVGPTTTSAALLTGGAFTIARNVTIVAGSTGEAIVGGYAAAASSFTGQITMNDDVSISQVAGGTVTFNRAAGAPTFTDGAGTFGITKIGDGTGVLAISNTYDGVTTVNAGILIVTANGALGSTTGGTVVNSGGTLGIQGNLNYATTEALTLNGTGVNNAGALNSLSGNNTYAGTITLGSDATIGSSTAGNTLTLSNTISLPNAAYELTVLGAGNTTASNVISGAGALIKDGTGTLTLSGASANTFTGSTTVLGGTLDLNKTAGINSIVGPLIIGDNTAEAARETVRLLTSDQISNTAAVTIRNDGILDFSTFSRSDTIGALTLESGAGTGASIVTGTGTLTLNANVTLNAFGTGAVAATIAGNLSLGASTRTFTVNDGSADPDLIVSAAISGTAAGAGITKTGDGTLQLSGTASNTYTGTTTVSTGTLQLNKTAGLNAIAGPLVIGDGAGTDSVELLASNQIANSAAVTVSTSGVLDLNNFSETLGNAASTFLTLESGAASAASVRTGTGTLTMAGNVAVNSIGGGATGATIDGRVALAPAVGTAVTFTVANGTADNDLNLDAIVSGTGGFTKAGAGTVEVTGANTYTGATTISAGTFTANNTSGSATGTGTTTIANGGTLDGFGTVGAVIINSGGTLSPGDDLGVITTGNITFNNGGRVAYTLSKPDLLPGDALFDSDLVNSGTHTLGSGGAVTTLVINNDSGDFGTGVYRLFNYSGTALSAANFSLSFSTPITAIRADATATLDFSTPGQVNLVMASATPVR
ncbi:MAG TPA: autotransporter-associated beta strand repeat-containing protein, partial [Planctomycetota bacterium]|nr:autotransporter-associated beta strand repeat-containing protein [Planctomycetota bacterium]